jgi:hypothetical protein
LKKISTTKQEAASLASPDALQTLHQSQRVELEEWLCNNISVVNKDKVAAYSAYFISQKLFSVEDITAELLDDPENTLSKIRDNFGPAAKRAFENKLLNKNLEGKAADIGQQQAVIVVDVGYCMLL